jgi:hypothetical protein
MRARITAVVCALAAMPASAAGFGVPPTLGPGGCDDLLQANADFEAYGPTDVSAQAGNGRVTANVNPAGTLTVFKWPNPSLYNLVKYFAVARDPTTGVVQAQAPNEGSFAGVRFTLRDGRRGFVWLRDLRVSQRYDSPDTPVPVTTYTSDALGLRLRDFDLAPPGRDRLVRDFWVTRTRRSPVRRASLVYFANFNPTASHIPLLPIADWCIAADGDGHAAYAGGAVVTSWAGQDAATGEARTMAVAFAFAGRDAAHQVGGDAYEPTSANAGPTDAYDDAADGLSGSTAADGQTTAALERRLRFRHRRAEARVTIAAGTDAAAALRALAAGRRKHFGAQHRAETRDWHRFLARTVLPRHPGARVRTVAKRSLISVRLARVAETGAIVASVNTQGPYGEDWIRDGAFLNRLLDTNGLTGWVTRHNRFYVRAQTTTAHPSALRPPGNWAMASYYDGVDGAPIPWEIDETGLGIWTLYDHARYLRGSTAKAYLASVYPTIVAAADFLAECEDPTNGLQCEASEDDNYTPSQGLHGAETVYLGLRSAVAAARTMGDTSARVTTWADRLARLKEAIDGLYDPQTKSYRVGDAAANGYIVDYGDGGWLLWPVRYKPFTDPTMAGEANAVFASAKKSFAAPRGQYEAKALLGLGYAWPRAHHAALRGMIAHIARDLTTPTGLIGESWQRLTSGRPIPVQDQPHVWEHALFYMAALKLDGRAPYRFARGSVYRRACDRGVAPRSAC